MSQPLESLDTLAEAIPESAKDIRINLKSVLQESSLNGAQRWGVATASAAASRHAALLATIRQRALEEAGAAVVDDALAAAALMAMNNVYYRFRHLVGKPVYGEKPARLRMQRIARPATNKADFELFCLAVSAINGCEVCLQSHEREVLGGGLTEDNVNDAVRIAATVQAAAVALEISSS